MSATPLVLLPGAARSAPEPDAAEAAVLAAAAEQRSASEHHGLAPSRTQPGAPSAA